MYLPNPPQTQALSSKTFRPPPLDGSLTLVELYEWHLQNTPHHRLFVFADENGDVKNILWPQAVEAIHVGARITRSRVGTQPKHKETPAVAIIASTDTITYFIMLMSIARANCIAFPISPRNSPAAIAHLLSKVNVKHVFLGHEHSMKSLAKDTIDILKSTHQSVPVPEITPVPLFEELFIGRKDNMNDLPIERKDPDDIIMFLHSSGSTQFPKPIPWRNRHFSQQTLVPYYGGRDLTDQIWSIHTMPMFHGMGVTQFCWTASAGSVVAAFEPKSPAVIPTPDRLYKAVVATKCDVIFCVPPFIEAWSRNPEYVEWLATRTGVLFGGGPLNKVVGDYMTSQGVSIFILYGLTEGGIISPIIPAEVDYDWDYFRFPDNIFKEMQPRGDYKYEFVIVSDPTYRPNVVNTKVNDADAFATSDLFTPHPSKPEYWRIFGRADDQIMHSNGEKTNPGPLESILNQDPHVQASVMFGRGHFQAGVVIDPKPGFKFDPIDEVKLAEFRNKIWTTVQKMNSFSPQHSRIFKEMIIVVKPSKPFQYTAKNTARRQAIIKDYEEEIEALYTTVEESTQSNIPPPMEWDLLSVTEFVSAIVNNVLVQKVGDKDDIFQHGCDSLQATWIRNSLLRGLLDSAELDARATVENFVYEHPSISSLSSYIFDIASGRSAIDSVAESQASKTAAMHAVVNKYTRDLLLQKLASSVHNPGSDIILVTGTTGGLGCYLLTALASAPKVSRVYAVNRSAKIGGQLSLVERQKLSLQDRGLDPTIVDSEKIHLLEADFSVTGFGLSSEVYQEIHNSVTHIIHNAWTVDFNLALASFEPSLRGLRNLVDFALSSPMSAYPKFIYTSSIGVFHNSAQGLNYKPAEESHIPAEVAAGIGYSESKWVSEQILAAVAEKTALKPLIVRVGQLSGGPRGAWNVKEWFPSLVQSVTVVQRFPTADGHVSWIPVNIAAKAIIDFLEKDFTSTPIVHLIHPRPVSWLSLAKYFSKELSVPLVSLSVWVEKLEYLSSSFSDSEVGKAEVELLKNVPALRLLPFFKAISQSATKEGEALGFPNLSVSNAVSLSSTLADHEIEQLGEADVKAWIGYWSRVGLLKFSTNTVS